LSGRRQNEGYAATICLTTLTLEHTAGLATWTPWADDSTYNLGAGGSKDGAFSQGRPKDSETYFEATFSDDDSEYIGRVALFRMASIDDAATERIEYKATKVALKTGEDNCRKSGGRHGKNRVLSVNRHDPTPKPSIECSMRSGSPQSPLDLLR